MICIELVQTDSAEEAESLMGQLNVSYPSGGKQLTVFINGEFDPGSERTLAAWIRHASRTRSRAFE